jgi:inactivated superfamily I helicase
MVFTEEKKIGVLCNMGIYDHKDLWEELLLIENSSFDNYSKLVLQSWLINEAARREGVTYTLLKKEAEKKAQN